MSRGQRNGSPRPLISVFYPWSRYFSFQVALHLYPRWWVYPVPDPMLLRKHGSAWNRTRGLWICSQELWPLDHRSGPPSISTHINWRLAGTGYNTLKCFWTQLHVYIRPDTEPEGCMCAQVKIRPSTSNDRIHRNVPEFKMLRHICTQGPGRSLNTNDLKK
jgi:hypothetical protein